MTTEEFSYLIKEENKPKSPALNLINNALDLFHYARDLALKTDMTIKRLSFEASSGMVLIEFNEVGR